MPVTAFSNFTDGLEPSRRRRDHFVTNIDLEDQRRWVPYADGVWLQPCHFNLTSGGFSVVLKGMPGAKLGTHYHVGTVRGDRSAGTGGTSSTTGSPGLERSSMSPQARRTRWSLPMTRPGRR